MKVFSKMAWLKDMIRIAETKDDIELIIINYHKKSSWLNDIEGKTEEEIDKIGYELYNEWFIEKGE